jgi:hypothetical protein
MRKLPIVILIALSFFTATVFAQDGGRPASGAPAGEKKGWPSVERHNFIRECIGTAKANLGEDAARYYCYCMQERLEIKYPAIEDAEKLTEADLQSPEFQRNVKECMVAGEWTAKDRGDFLRECVNSAKIALGEGKANTYCECMLFKVEKAYPRPEDAAQLTEEKLSTPAWKNTIQGCKDF